MELFHLGYMVKYLIYEENILTYAQLKPKGWTMDIHWCRLVLSNSSGGDFIR
jgi:hypothetical protein